MIHALELQHEVEQFLFKEARLIDNRELDDWLDLWTLDCRYYVPVRHNGSAPVGEGLLAVNQELGAEHETAWIDDDKMLLFARVMRLRTGKAWSENPLARTRRVISNIEVQMTDVEGHFRVFSNSAQYRSRRQTEENWFVCQRQDLLVRSEAGLQIKERKITLDSAVLTSSYLTLI